MKSVMEQANMNHPAADPILGGFCSQLSAPALHELHSLMVSVTYPEDSMLFEEEERLRGVFVLLSGLVKLSVGSAEGKNLILRLARPGSVLGLSAAISGTPYENHATAVHRCEVGFVRIDDFNRFLGRHVEVYEAISRELIAQQNQAWEQLRIVGLSNTISGRLAKLLLDWSAAGQATRHGIRVKVPLTHEEIGEFIGTTRETVTRTLGDFKNRHLVELQGSTLMIANRAGLERMGAA